MLWRRPQRATDDRPGRLAIKGCDLVNLPHAFRPWLLRSVLGNAFGSAGGRVFVDHQRSLAFAQVVAEPGRDHWFIVRLVAEAGVTDGGRELLDRIAREAGTRGVIRLHTLVTEHPDVLEWWQRAGFTPFRRVILLTTTAEGRHAPPEGTIRVQEAVDAWEVQRLYERLTPRPVQYAEARNRATWQVGRRAGWRVRGFLLSNGQETTAYCRVRSRGKWHLVEVLAPDHAADDAVSLVRYAIGQSARPHDQVLLVLPEEAPCMLAAFERAGFRTQERRVWLARYTVRRIRVGTLASDAASLAALADARRAFYRRERPKVAVVERATSH